MSDATKKLILGAFLALIAIGALVVLLRSFSKATQGVDPRTQLANPPELSTPRPLDSLGD